MEIQPLGQRELDALTHLARRPDVVRFGDHLEVDPPSVFGAWLGEADANRQLSLGAYEGGALVAAARLSTTSRRRRTHVGIVELLAPWTGGDAAVDALLAALVDAADRWLALSRLELRAPAEHPQIRSVYEGHGFAVETTMRGSVMRDGAFADEASLARLRPGLVAPAPIAGRPEPRAKQPPPSDLTFRAIDPAKDAAVWTETLSSESVIWGTLQLPHQHPEAWERRLASNDPQHIVSLAAETGGVIAAGGVLVIPPVLRRRHTATLGMHVGPEHQGQGIGGRLMRELLAIGDRLGLARIELEVFGDNPRALRVYEAAGFAHEGWRRLSCFRDGALVDDLMMARWRE
ncbi:MAG: GNAT family N-acetyltransferase [Myxococcales bacterium]|nr:GNAT family N-acetyltransferase [Myxococcales bacterium]